MKVVCIEKDMGETKCTRTLRIIPTIPSPNKGEVLEVIKTKRQIDGTLTYSFKEYNSFGCTNYFDVKYFRPIDDDFTDKLVCELEEEMQHEFEEQELAKI